MVKQQQAKVNKDVRVGVMCFFWGGVGKLVI